MESDGNARKRTQRVVTWLRGLGEKLPFDDLVVFISHGGALALILKEVLGQGEPALNYGGYDNTSVSAFILGKDLYVPPP